MFQDKFLTPLELNGGINVLELLMNRIRSLFEGGNIPVPVIFACNTKNRPLIEEFMKEKKYFGMDPSKIRYLQVPMMPIMDPKGKLCMTF